MTVRTTRPARVRGPWRRPRPVVRRRPTWPVPEVDPVVSARIRRAAHAELTWRDASLGARAHHVWRGRVEPVLVWTASALYVVWALAHLVPG